MKNNLYYVDAIVDEYITLRKGGVSDPLTLMKTLLRAVSVLRKTNKSVRAQDPHTMMR